MAGHLEASSVERASQEIEHAALDSCDQALWVIDLERLSIGWANRAGLAILRADSLAALKPVDPASSNEARAWLERHHAQLADGQEVVDDWTFYPHGQPVTLLCSFKLLPAHGGQRSLLLEARERADDARTIIDRRAVEALRHTSGMISLFSLDGAVILQNPSAERCFGAISEPRNTFAGRFRDPALAEHALRRLSEGKHFHGDVEVQTAAGVRWHTIDCRRAVDPVLGEPAIVVDQRDATERKVSEDALRDREERFRALCMHVPIGIFLAQPDGACTFVNRRWCEIAGMSESEALQYGWHRLIHPDDREQFAAEWRRMVSAAQEATMQLRYRRPSGSDVWVSVNTVPAIDAEGKLNGYLGAVSDVTHTLLSEQRYSTVFEHSSDAHMLLDEQGLVIDCNQGAVALTGAPSKSALVGQSPARFSPPPPPGVDPIKQSRALLELAALHGTHRFDAVHQHADGRITVAEVALTCVSSGGKRVYFASAHDATERKEAERAIVRSREEALEASRLKSQFLANMSHEIRTPMNGVLGMLQLTLGTELSSEQREYLGAAHASAEGLLEIINDILDLSKIEAGKLTIDTTEMSVQEVLRGSLHGVALRAHAKNLELVARLESDVPPIILGDPVRLRQVLTNLVGNAVKFTDAGHVAVSLALRVRDGARYLSCEVVDSGIGISRERQETIFDAFQQADGSTTRRYGGTGLGLTICRELVAMMGGQLRVESERGQGSRFSFAIPLHVPDAPARLPREPSIAGFRVLVVDDHPLARAALIDMLEALGAHVTSAATVQQTFAVLEGTALPVDAALIDQGLGEQSGLELPRVLRRYPACRTTRFTLLRGQERPSGGQLSDAGFALALDKPVLRNDLLRALTTQPEPPTVTGHYPGHSDRMMPTEKPPAMSILIVEDHPINAHFLSSLLHRHGHRVVHALNGVRALAAFESDNFDVILMDVQMPEMDGLEATRRIRERERERGTRVPIIALTANAMKGDPEECLAAGMDHYISKPVDIPQLHQALARFARKERQSSPRPPSMPAGERVSAARTHELEPPFRREELLARASGDPRFMADLIHIFLASQQDMMRDVESSVASRDESAVRNAAHRLKGALQLVCAVPSASIAKELEQAARAGQPDLFAGCLSRLRAEMRRLREALGHGNDRP